MLKGMEGRSTERWSGSESREGNRRVCEGWREKDGVKRREEGGRVGEKKTGRGKSERKGLGEGVGEKEQDKEGERKNIRGCAVSSPRSL